MRRAWHIREARGDFIIARRCDVGPSEPSAVPPATFARNLDRWLADTTSRQILRRVVESVYGHAPFPARVTSPEFLRHYLKTQLEKALRHRDLVVMLMPTETVAGAPSGAADAKKSVLEEPPSRRAKESVLGEAPTKRADTHWIEFELLDELGKPVGGQRYQVELPDGGTREGVLDPSGRLHLEVTPPGTCKISFPEIDASEWHAG